MSTPPVRRVAYYYDEEIGNYYFGPGHPLKPHRVRMAHNLIENYGLYRKMEIFRPQPASEQDLGAFHTDDYVYFLKQVNCDNQATYLRELNRFNMDVDCPVFDGLFEYCQSVAGSTLGACFRLNRKLANVAINWSGGNSHAKRGEAGGFGYVNDCVLGILELLKFHKRVLYINLDVTHSDGVEEAFYTTDRVCTYSIHQYGPDMYPGTGHREDIGVGEGKAYSVNIPLKAGVDNHTYNNIVDKTLPVLFEQYKPDAIVLQCGGNAVVGDRFGHFNLTTQALSHVLDIVLQANLPTLVLGGGGTSLRNMGRIWTQLTAQIVGETVDACIPVSNYYDYYAPEYTMHIPASNMANCNTPEELERTIQSVVEQIKLMTNK